MATLKTLSSIRKPKDDTRRVCSHVAASFLLAAKSQPWKEVALATSCSVLKETATQGASHAFCLEFFFVGRGEMSSPLLHTWKVPLGWWYLSV